MVGGRTLGAPAPRRPVEEAGRACAVSEPAAHTADESRRRPTELPWESCMGWGGIGACIGEDVICMCVHVVDPRIAIHGPRASGLNLPERIYRMYM